MKANRKCSQYRIIYKLFIHLLTVINSKDHCLFHIKIQEAAGKRSLAQRLKA